MEGYLKKWVNYLSGYKQRYFIIQHDILTYFEEKGSPVKGVISLKIANIHDDPSDALKIIIHTGTDEIILKAESTGAKMRWLSALREGQRSILVEEEKKNYPEKEIK
jgi:hypothetical protein